MEQNGSKSVVAAPLVDYAAGKPKVEDEWTPTAKCLLIIGLILSLLYVVGSAGTAFATFYPLYAAFGSLLVRGYRDDYRTILSLAASTVLLIGNVACLIGWRWGRIVLWSGAAGMIIVLVDQLITSDSAMAFQTQPSVWGKIGGAAWSIANLASWMVYPVLTFFLIRRRRIAPD